MGAVARGGQQRRRAGLRAGLPTRRGYPISPLDTSNGSLTLRSKLYLAILLLLPWAKELLTRKGVNFHEIDVTADRQTRQHMIERANGRGTVPQIFIGSNHVGGCDELYALEEAGQLDPLLGVGEG